MEYTVARVSHLLAVVHTLLRWAKRQTLHANRGAFDAAGCRSAPERSITSSVTSTSERLGTMRETAWNKKIERNVEREYSSNKSESDFNANSDRGTITGVDSEVTPPPSGTCAVAPPLGSSPGTFRIPSQTTR